MRPPERVGIVCRIMKRSASVPSLVRNTRQRTAPPSQWRRDGDVRMALICGQLYTAFSWYFASSPSGSQKRKVHGACSVDTDAVRLLGGDEKTLKGFTGVCASDLRELLPGVDQLSAKAVPTACLAGRKGAGFVKVCRPGSSTEANILWRVEALDAVGAGDAQ